MERALGSRYRLEQELGRGAMGQVFLGLDPDGNRYACKILRPELTADPAAVARFLQEGNILVSLRHPNLVGLHDLVAEGGTVGIVMDLVTGSDLRRLLAASRPLLPAEAARIGAGIAWALHTVHEAGVVHRDIKPENILLDETAAPPTPRLTDFGISRIAGEADFGRSSMLLGTPQYVAPELIEGGQPTPAADLYSLGIVLYEMCCGVAPFAGAPMLTVLRMHAEMTPGRPDGIPDPLWDLISWLLAKGPGGRPQSAAKVAALLDALSVDLRGVPVAPRLETPPPPLPAVHGLETTIVPGVGRNPVTVDGPRRWGRLIGAAVVALLLVGGGITYLSARGGDSNRVAAGQGGASPAAQDSGVGGTPTVIGGSTDSTQAGGATEPTATASPTPEAPTGPAPNLVGRTLADAPSLLPASVILVPTNTLDDRAVDGTILAQDPAAGGALTTRMKVTVARQPVVTYLAEQEPAIGSWDNADQPAAISGKQFPHSLSHAIYSCYSSPDPIEYNLGRSYRKLVLSSGLDDNGKDSSLVARLELFVDNRPVYTGTIQFGRPTLVSIDVTNGLRLKIQWETISGNCNTDYLVLGQPELLGLPGEVPQSTDSTDTGTDSGTDTPTDSPTS